MTGVQTCALPICLEGFHGGAGKDGGFDVAKRQNGSAIGIKDGDRAAMLGFNGLTTIDFNKNRMGAHNNVSKRQDHSGSRTSKLLRQGSRLFFGLRLERCR